MTTRSYEIGAFVSEHSFSLPFLAEPGSKTVISVFQDSDTGQFEILAENETHDGIMTELELRKAKHEDAKEIMKIALARMESEKEESVVFHLTGTSSIEFA